jgi:hypothetical protein
MAWTKLGQIFDEEEEEVMRYAGQGGNPFKKP